MKQLAQAAGLCLMLLTAAWGLLYMEEKTSRQTALDRALSAAMEETLRTKMLTPYYELTSDEAMVADVLRALLPAVGDATLTLRLYGCDLSYGFLDMEAVAESPFPIFGPVTVRSRQSLITDLQAE